jgi:hypothetical protein
VRQRAEAHRPDPSFPITQTEAAILAAPRPLAETPARARVNGYCAGCRSKTTFVFDDRRGWCCEKCPAVLLARPLAETDDERKARTDRLFEKWDGALAKMADGPAPASRSDGWCCELYRHTMRPEYLAEPSHDPGCPSRAPPASRSGDPGARCPTCSGLGGFSPYGNPQTQDRYSIACVDCGGTGRAPPPASGDARTPGAKT